MKQFTRKFSFKKIAQYCVVLIAIIFFLYFSLLIFLLYFQNGFVEKKFAKESGGIQNIKVRTHSIFEGGLSATFEIAGKGSIEIMYGIAGLEYIRRIGEFDTIFMCPEDKNSAIVLGLGKGNKFQKWFPFQINTLHELVSHYDDIISILKTFPKTPDPDYAVITTSKPFGLGKKTNCSLYVKNR